MALPVRPREGGAAGEAGPADPPGLGIFGIDDGEVSSVLRRDRPLLLSLLARLLGTLSELADAAAPELPVQLHKLRGGAQVVGAMALAEAAARLEQSLSRADAAGRQEAHAAMMQAAQALAQAAAPALTAERERLQQLRAIEQAQAAACTAPDAAALAPLRQALAEHSTRAVAEVERLAGPLRHDLGAAGLEQLRAALAEFDFGAAAQLLDSRERQRGTEPAG